MDISALWQLFLYTGLPEVYNMYRKQKEEARTEDKPCRGARCYDTYSNSGIGSSGGQLQRK